MVAILKFGLFAYCIYPIIWFGTFILEHVGEIMAAMMIYEYNVIIIADVRHFKGDRRLDSFCFTKSLTVWHKCPSKASLSRRIRVLEENTT